MDEEQRKVDQYGFERPPDFDYKTYDEFMSRYVSVLTRRAGRWATLMNGKEELSVSQKLKRFVRKGIPSEHRPMVWMYVSGAEARRRERPDLYQKLLNGPHEEQLVEVIKIDMHRTFPDNIYFKGVMSEPKANVDTLFNVLVALAHNNRSVGYCQENSKFSIAVMSQFYRRWVCAPQGMNFIAGLMLLIVKDEEQVFWLMDTLLNKILPDYYAIDMIGVKVDCDVLGELIRIKCPDVHRLAESCGCAWSIVATKWFICLFVDVVPVETVLRIWDCLFLEGSKILFRVAVTLIKKQSSAILHCQSFPEVMAVFRGISSSQLTMNCHEFIESIFKEPGSFSQSLIDRLRAECRQKLISGDH